ncbi:MAG: hypothetical protein AAGA60_25605 [Cyanobacteria bacterium P01_E01_bin.42]
MGKGAQERKLGIYDFIRCQWPEFVVLAVKAPLEKIVRTFIEYSNNQKTTGRYAIVNREISWKSNLATRKSIKHDPVVRGYTFIQIHDNDWTVIWGSLSSCSSIKGTLIHENAINLSNILETKAIILSEENTSSSIGYSLYEQGKVIENFGYVRYTYASFESEFRERPEIIDICLEAEIAREEKMIEAYRKAEQNGNIEEFYEIYRYEKDENREKTNDTTQKSNISEDWGLEFINDFFCQLGVYLPVCYPVQDKDETLLAIDRVSEEAIARADWIEVTQTLDFFANDDGLNDIPF